MGIKAGIFGPLPAPIPFVQIAGTTEPLPVTAAPLLQVAVATIPLAPDAATDTNLALVASTLAENVVVTQLGLATVAADAAANSALLLTATNTVASTAAAGLATVAADAAANSALLLTATNTVAAVAAATAAASDAILTSILAATSAPVSVNNFPATQAVSGTVGVNNFPATQPVSGAVTVSNFPATQAVSNTPVQNSGKTVNRFVLAQAGVAGTTVIAAASPGNKHKIIGVMLTMSAAGTVKFRDTVDLTGAMNLLGSTPLIIPPDPTFPLVETLTNRALNIVTTGGGANGVILFITES